MTEQSNVDAVNAPCASRHANAAPARCWSAHANCALMTKYLDRFAGVGFTTGLAERAQPQAQWSHSKYHLYAAGMSA